MVQIIAQVGLTIQTSLLRIERQKTSIGLLDARAFPLTCIDLLLLRNPHHHHITIMYTPSKRMSMIIHTPSKRMCMIIHTNSSSSSIAITMKGRRGMTSKDIRLTKSLSNTGLPLLL